jgi:hypothetical protein
MAGIISGVAGMNSSLGLLQSVFLGRKISCTEVTHHPIFILGHWRSGTTLLHELMVQDPRHSFPDTYACFSPNHFLLTRKVLPPLLNIIMPMRRPVDNMPVGWLHPQEDEFAMCNMGSPSPYLTMAFPNESPQDEAYLTLEGLSSDERAQWKATFGWFLKCLWLADPKRTVLKSPPHTARVKALVEMFPDARFVHIVRDPYVIFASTVNLWKRLYLDQGFQKPNYKGLEEHVFRTFERMYASFESQRSLIPKGRFSEVRYEDLTRDTIPQMQRIYQELELGEFDRAKPAMEKYLEGQSNYKKNRYELSPEARQEISRRWSDYIHRYGYAAPADQDAA